MMLPAKRDGWDAAVRPIPWPERVRAHSIDTVRPEFVFVLEQALGHRAYGARLEGALAARPDVAATVIRVEPAHSGSVTSLPGLRNHTVQASWQARAALARRSRQGPIDALFIHTQCASLLARGFMRSIPTVISMDATPANYDQLGDGYGHRRQGMLAESLKGWIYRAAFRAASSLVVWSRWAGDSLVGDYAVPAEKIQVIRPGVDLTRFLPRPPRHEGPVRVLFVGGDLRRKGGYDLLQAMAVLGDRAECDLVTDAAPVDIPAGARVRIHRGVTPDSPELPQLYRRADIFALPTRAECYGQVIAEAMASALPIVTCPGGAMEEFVTDGVNGLLVPAGSPAALAAALTTLIDHPEMRALMGKRNLELAWSQHDAERSTDLLLETMRYVSTRRAPLATPSAAA